MPNDVEIVVTSKDDTSAGFKSAKDGVKDVGDSFDHARDKADKAEERAMGFRDVLTGIADSGAGFKQVMEGDYAGGLLTLGMGIGDLASGFANLLIPVLGGLVGGLKGATTAVKLFTISLLTNPIFLIITAIVLLVAGLVILYKKSETARDIMNKAFAAIGGAVLNMADVALEGFKFLVMTALDAAGALLAIAAKIPGPQQDAMKKASAAFNDFKTSAGKALDDAGKKIDDWKTKLAAMPKVAKIEGNIKDLEAKLTTAKQQLKDPNLTKARKANIQANIDDLTRKIANAKGQIAGLKGKTVTITYKGVTSGIVRTQDINRIGSAGREAHGGGVKGFAGGGGPTGNRFLAGEAGPEFIDLSGGTARITPANNTRRQMGSSGISTVVLQVKSGGSKFEDLFVEMMREYVRVVGGGDVQLALGRA